MSKTIDEMIAVMQAYKDRKKIECKSWKSTDWQEIKEPEWNWYTNDYRIAEEPKYRAYENAKRMTKRQFKKKCKQLGIIYTDMGKFNPLTAEDIINAVEETNLDFKALKEQSDYLSKYKEEQK